jgi:replicative DNA helicase
MSAVVDGLRLPPQHIEAEQAVLGALMLTPDALLRIRDWLHEDDFYRKDHRLVFRAICELDDRKQPCDAVTLSDWFGDNGLGEYLTDGVGYLIDLANTTPSAANVVAYAEIVLEKSKLRKAVDIGTSLAEGAFAPHADSSQIFAIANERVSKMQQSAIRTGPVLPKKALDGYFQAMMRRYESNSPLIGFETPWSSVSEAIMGWQEETAYILAGRPGMGKSVLGFQAAFDMALRGEPTALFSAEMSAEQVMARMIACFGLIPYRWVQKPYDCPDAEMYWARMTAVIARIKDAPLWIDDTASLTCEQWVARMKRLHKQVGLRMGVLDHIHHMTIDTNKEPRHEFGRIALAGKNMSREMHIPMLMLAQLNRANTQRADKRPVMSDLRESGEIEQVVDVIAFVHREDYYNKNTHLKGTVEWINAKGRDVNVNEPIYLTNRYDQMRAENYDGIPPEAPAPTTKGGWGNKRGKD